MLHGLRHSLVTGMLGLGEFLERLYFRSGVQLVLKLSWQIYREGSHESQSGHPVYSVPDRATSPLNHSGDQGQAVLTPRAC